MYDHTRFLQNMEECKKKIDSRWRKIKWCSVLSLFGLCMAVGGTIAAKYVPLWAFKAQIVTWLGVAVFTASWLTYCVLFERFKQQSKRILNLLLYNSRSSS